MPLLLDKRTMIMKAESTAGTSIIGSMADADNDIEFRDIQYTKEISEYVRKMATGGHDHNRSIMGKRKATITGSFDLNFSGTSATEPKYGKVLKALGQLKSGTTDVDWSPDKSIDLSTVSILIQDEYLGGSAPLALGIQFKGCMGNGKIISDQIGDGVRVEFEMQGVFVTVANIANANILALTSPESALPDSTLSATLSLGGNSKLFEKFELDFGNKIEYLTDSGDSDGAGLRYAYIMQRDPRYTVDPKASLTTEDDDHASFIAGTELVLDFDTTNFGIDSSKCQILSIGDSEQGGLVVNELVMRPNIVSGGYPWVLKHK